AVVRVVGAGTEVIGGHIRVHVGGCRQWGHRVHVLGQRAHLAHRNLVTHKRSLAVVGPRSHGVGIVNRDAVTAGIGQAAEISYAVRGRPHISRHGGSRPQTHFFPGEEEEGPVLAVVDLGYKDRSPHRRAELIAYQVRRLGERVLPLPRYAEAAIAAGFEQPTVDHVGSTARGHNGVCGAVEFGAGNAGFNTEFLNRIQSRRASLDVSGVPAVQRHPVLDILHGGVSQAVNLRLGRTGSLQARRRLLNQAGDGTPIQRELLDTGALHHRGNGRTGGGDQRRYVTEHRDGFTPGRNAESRGDGGRLPNRQGYLPLPLVHARRGDGQTIIAGLQ